MKTLLVAAALLLAVGYGYPLLNEDTGTTCRALERRVIATVPPSPGARPGDEAMARAFLGVLIGGLSDGTFAATAIKQRYPNLPAAVGCAVAYWQLVFDPSALQGATARRSPNSLK
jgi:hypothetical protein